MHATVCVSCAKCPASNLAPRRGEAAARVGTFSMTGLDSQSREVGAGVELRLGVLALWLTDRRLLWP